MPPLLLTKDLTKHFGATRALDGVSLEVHQGITGLLGANGAGKSTMIKIVLGLIDPDSGSTEFMGVDTRSSPLVRERIGYMPEHDCLPPKVSATEFVSHMAQVSGLPPSEARTRAADVLRHVGLDEERYRSMGTYSTGMKQRVKLAQALAHDPLMILLDEPTSGLDPAGRQEMLDLIRRTGTEFGISILMTSHLMGDVERSSDRIIVLDAGKVLREGEVSGFTQETETLIINVVEGTEELSGALAKRGVTATLERGALIVEDADTATYDAIRDAVVESGALLYRLAPRRHSLNEVFDADDENLENGQ
ncbi:MAG: ABC transporter ATP-binding protein [Dehalococcoidia bacterium]